MLLIPVRSRHCLKTIFAVCGLHQKDSAVTLKHFKIIVSNGYYVESFFGLQLRH